MNELSTFSVDIPVHQIAGAICNAVLRAAQEIQAITRAIAAA
jgi:hypothetical protein